MLQDVQHGVEPHVFSASDVLSAVLMQQQKLQYNENLDDPTLSSKNYSSSISSVDDNRNKRENPVHSCVNS